MFGSSQRRSSQTTSWKPKEKAEQASVESRTIFLYYQNVLQKQIRWLIANKSYPEQLEDCAKSIWILWVSQQGDLDSKGSIATISVRYPLAICFLASNALGLAMTIQQAAG